MKLSEVKGERAFDIWADLTEVVRPITEDPEASALFCRQKLPEGMTAVEFGAQWLRSAAVKLIKAHKTDIINVVSMIEGVTPKEYVANINGEKIMSDVADLIGDDLFRSIFFSAQQSIEIQSGSAQENTAESTT